MATEAIDRADGIFLSQHAYEQLHQRLHNGSLRPGSRLVIRALAAELGASTIPVREAIARLASEGLLEFRPGAGAFVRSPDPNELGELYDVQEALEVLAAGEAARFANGHLIAELKGVCEGFRQVAADLVSGQHATLKQLNRWLECEEQFHTRLVAAAHNRWLVKVNREIRILIQAFATHRASPRMLSHDRAQALLRRLEEFLDLLANRDAEKARAWMGKHAQLGRDMVLASPSTEDGATRGLSRGP